MSKIKKSLEYILFILVPITIIVLVFIMTLYLK